MAAPKARGDTSGRRKYRKEQELRITGQKGAVKEPGQSAVPLEWLQKLPLCDLISFTDILISKHFRFKSTYFQTMANAAATKAEGREVGETWLGAHADLLAFAVIVVGLVARLWAASRNVPQSR